LNSSLARKYLLRGIKDLKTGKKEQGERELLFAGKLDPSNRRIPLTLAKSSFPGLKKTVKYLAGYISTIGFLNNKIFFVKTLLLLFILLSFWVILATVGASIVYFISYITKWFQGKTNISGLWIIAILFSMYVWLPIQIVFLILVAMSLLKMKKPDLIRCSVLLILLPFFTSYSYIISDSFNPHSYIYKEFKARFDPYNYQLDSPVTPYGYSIKGIQEAKKGNFEESKDLFEKGYNIRRDINYLVNLCSVYYDEGDTARTLNMCKNILADDPQNEIANITIIQILYNQLNFDEAEAHMRETGFRLTTGISNLELPIYNYPPENWLYKYIFVPRSLLKKLTNKNQLILIIIGVCLAGMTFLKKEKEVYCPICKSIMLMGKTKENMCLSCITKLSLTKSKSIRERLKRRIITKAYKLDKATNILMNLIIPGSAHFYKKRNFEGIIISFFSAFLLLILLYSVFFQTKVSLQYKTYMGNNIFTIFVILFYSFVIFSSWRLEPNGNGR
jgi:tetratricopeptide (TPR) repeat protein